MTHRHVTDLGIQLLGVCLVGLTLAFAALHIMRPSDGARLEPDKPVWSQDGITVTPFEQGAHGGLQQGDIVVAVAGRSMEEWAQLLVNPDVARPHWHVGDVVTYRVIRAGREMDVPVTLGAYPIGAMLGSVWGSIVFALAFALIAAFVFIRRPADRAARAMLLAGCCLLSAQSWALGLQVSDLVNPIGFWLFQITDFGAYTLFWASLLHFALLFPRPHPWTTRWRWLIPAIYALPALYVVTYLVTMRATTSNTLEWIGTWTPGQGIISAVYFAAAIVVVFDTRRINRDAITKRQIRWIVYAVVVFGGAGQILSILPGDVFGHAIISTNVLGLLLLPIPIAFAFAILRYRLFDIDVIIHRTLVYGTLTALLALVYGLSVLVLQTLAGRLSGLTTDWPPAIVASTLLIAALFRPLRTRLQSVIDRRFYRHKYDAAQELAAFGASLREQTELDDLRGRLIAVVEETMQPTSVSLWFAAPHPTPGHD
jgi:two-component system, NarL family, sensor kinase